ncbi:hypothetical protein, partial [Leucobacter sp. NPDC077196]|uniref:hypothetical protein n=1 Tax=Leucobacter sp. NPDC077196 TaxID=3154959 RepID=UPI003432AB5B
MSHNAEVPTRAWASRGRLSVGKGLVGAIAAVVLALGGALAAPTIANAEEMTSLALSAVPAEGSLTVAATVSNPPAGSPGTYV